MPSPSNQTKTPRSPTSPSTTPAKSPKCRDSSSTATHQIGTPTILLFSISLLSPTTLQPTADRTSDPRPQHPPPTSPSRPPPSRPRPSPPALLSPLPRPPLALGTLPTPPRPQPCPHRHHLLEDIAVAALRRREGVQMRVLLPKHGVPGDSGGDEGAGAVADGRVGGEGEMF